MTAVYLLYVGVVVFAYWRDLRSKTLAHLMGKHPHLAHIIASNPDITEADIAALNEQHKAGGMQIIAGSPHTRVSSTEKLPLLSVEIDEELGDDGVIVEEDIEEASSPSAESSFYSRTLDHFNRLMMMPIRWTLSRILPSLHSSPSPAGEEDFVPLWKVSTVLGMSIVFISISASVIVTFSEALVQSLNIDSSTIGATLVALGAEVS